MRTWIGAQLLAVSVGLLSGQPAAAQDTPTKVVGRTILVVDDPEGGAMTRQLTLSAVMLFASMSDPQDSVGLFANAASPVRRSPESVPQAASGLRAAISGLNQAKAAPFSEVSEFAQQAFGKPLPGVRDAVVVIAHAPREGAPNPQIAPEAIDQFVRWKVPVFVVGFGGRADPALYSSITQATGGRGYAVLKGADLKRAFNSILSEIHDAESLPVIGDRMVMDDSISEATMVVPKKVRLITPSERILMSKTKYPGVKWETFEDYDLVRISNPEAGTWRVRQPDDQQGGVVGRVNASTVRLKATIGPRTPMVGDQTYIRAHLEDNGNRVDAYAVLKHLVFEAEIYDPSGRSHPVRLERMDDGTFFGQFKNELEGYHQVKLTAFSPEVQREREFMFRVSPTCFIGEMFQDLETRAPSVVVHMSPSCPTFSELYAQLLVEHEGRVVDQSYFERVGKQLRASAGAPELGQAHTLQVQIRARTIDGHKVTSKAGGPFEVEARQPTLADYVAAVGKRLFALNVPFIMVGLGYMAVRHQKKPKKAKKKKTEEA